MFCILFETFSLKQEEAAWSDYLLIRSTFYPSACGQCKNTYSPRTLLSHWTKQTHKNPANNLLLRAVGKAHRPPSVDVGFYGFGSSWLRTLHTGNLRHDEKSRLPLCALPVLTTNGFPLGLISPWKKKKTVWAVFLSFWRTIVKVGKKNKKKKLPLPYLLKWMIAWNCLFSPKFPKLRAVPLPPASTPFFIIYQTFFSIQLSKERLDSHEARPLVIRPAVFSQRADLLLKKPASACSFFLAGKGA